MMMIPNNNNNNNAAAVAITDHAAVKAINNNETFDSGTKMDLSDAAAAAVISQNSNANTTADYVDLAQQQAMHMGNSNFMQQQQAHQPVQTFPYATNHEFNANAAVVNEIDPATQNHHAFHATTPISTGQVIQQQVEPNSAMKVIDLANCITIRDKLDNIMHKRTMKSIVFRYPRFAIKSYGKERRYLCPPPHLSIKGKGWEGDLYSTDGNLVVASQQQRHDETSQSQNFSSEYCEQYVSNMPNFNGNITENRDSFIMNDPYQNGLNGANYNPSTNNNSFKPTQNPFYSILTIPGIDLMDSGHIEFDDEKNGYATRIFIPDSKDVSNGIILNSMNSFAFSLTIVKNDIPLCSFNSDYIKLKSKALSYTKQASNNASEDACVTSGSCISLYSRIHAHKSNTRFLYIEDGKFTAHPLYWDSFIIYKVHENSSEAEFEPIPGVINYGDYVKIVSTQHNVSLPCMQIFPVEIKSSVEAKPIQFLSRCSFRFRYNESKFMSLEVQRDIIADEAIVETKKSGIFQVKEEAIWTVTKISSSLYSFIELAKPQYSISPFPSVQSISLHGSDCTYYLKIRGFNFTPLLSVWFGNIECGTFYQCKESILAVLPQFETLSGFIKSPNEIAAPLFLMRRDLVLYPSQFNVEFRFNSLATHPNDFVFNAKYCPFEEGLEDPEVLSQNLLC